MGFTENYKSLMIPGGESPNISIFLGGYISIATPKGSTRHLCTLKASHLRTLQTSHPRTEKPRHPRTKSGHPRTLMLGTSHFGFGWGGGGVLKGPTFTYAEIVKVTYAENYPHTFSTSVAWVGGVWVGWGGVG